MESSGGATQSTFREPTTVQLTRAGILIAGLGALMVVFNPLGLAIVGLFLGVLGAFMAARGGMGHPWYWALALGAALMVLSRLIADGSQTLGGWLAVIGAVCILVAASLGYPLASDLEE
jgi:hypothetical protein